MEAAASLQAGLGDEEEAAMRPRSRSVAGLHLDRLLTPQPQETLEN
jgi:hypothetical protein